MTISLLRVCANICLNQNYQKIRENVAVIQNFFMTHAEIWCLFNKGQPISKANYGVLNSSKKRTKLTILSRENGNWCNLEGRFWYINLRLTSEFDLTTVDRKSKEKGVIFVWFRFLIKKGDNIVSKWNFVGFLVTLGCNKIKQVLLHYF